jgi:hypothetical protein
MLEQAKEGAQIIEFPLAPGKEFNLAVVAWMAKAEYSFMNRFRDRF